MVISKVIATVDKLLFGALLVAALQVPLFADHYRQFLAGEVFAVQLQVDGYEQTAQEHGFADVYSMVDRHLGNSEPSVRKDAEQKLETLAGLEDLKSGVRIFEDGHLMTQLLYILEPSRFEQFESVMSNYRFGIPISSQAIVFGVLMALVLNFILTLPFRLVSRLYRRRKKKPGVVSL